MRNIYRQYIFSILFSLVVVTAHAQTALPLMPYPKEVQLSEGKLYLTGETSLSIEGKYSDRLSKEGAHFLRQLVEQTGLFINQSKVVGVIDQATIQVKSSAIGQVEIGENESYTIQIDQSGVKLNAANDIGASRGLMTLLQLVQADSKGYYWPHVAIDDEPRFRWRGMMIDPSRHFLPVTDLKRNIDAMAAVKLNVLHLHLSDDQGFRFESKVFPKLNALGTDGNYYSQEELKDIVDSASQKGILIVPEIDVPGHATAILTAYPELGSKDTTYVLERFAGIFDPTLDPTNEEVYVFLDELFAEIVTIFPGPYFNIGGDENLGKHWNESEHIQNFMKKNGIKSNHELQGYFNLRLQKILAQYEKRMMGWEEIMIDDLEKSALIHSWKGAWEGAEPKKSLYTAAAEGYQTILSNGYYLDLMFTTKSSYLVDPAPKSDNLSDFQRSNILGGEICMWSELVIPQTLESRLWPRAAAIAERFWSPEEINDVEDMYDRMDHISLWLENFGLKHISEPNRIIRKLAAGHDTEPLHLLLDMVEPMKGYTRNPGGTMYNTFSPYTKWVDAATADAPGARAFNNQVDCYLNSKIGCQDLKPVLESLAENHDQVMKIIADSPSLQEIQGLSANASRVATLALETLDYLESNSKPKSKWFVEAKDILNEASEQGGRTELQVISGVSDLVTALEGEVK